MSAYDDSTGVKLWETPVGIAGYPYPTQSSPVVGSSGRVYVAAFPKVTALDAASGTLLWEAGPVGLSRGTPALGPDETLFVSGGGYLSALSGNTGDEQWRSSTPSEIASQPCLGSYGLLYAGAKDGRLFALHAADGTVAWEFATGGAVEASPVISGDGSVLVPSRDGKLYAIDGQTGSKRWEYNTQAPLRASPSIGLNDRVFVSSGNKLHGIDGLTGVQLWEVAVHSPTASPAIGADGTVLVGDESGVFRALDGETGTELWRAAVDLQIRSSPVISPEGIAYVGSMASVYALYVGTSLADSPWPMFGRDPRHTGSTAPEVPRIRSIVSEAGAVRIEWNGPGKLQQSVDLRTTEWEPVPGATSPYVAPAAGRQGYFRLQAP